MKMLRSAVTSLAVMFLFAVVANAQGGFEAYFGLGSAHDGSTGQLLDLLGTGTPQPTSAMGGVFGTLGGGVMVNSHLGIGAEVLWRFTQGDYAGLGYRPVFYDFNAIYVPSIRSKRAVPELQAGFGGASLRFYGGQEYCDPFTGRCSNFAGSSNHLQLHAGVGLRLYVKENIFIRPSFDYHWVRNLDEFKSGSVPAWSIAIGFGGGQ